VVTPADTAWERNPLGRVRILPSPEREDVRTFSVDVFELSIPAGSRPEAEIAERYYARIAKEPTRHDFEQGDILYVPQNTVAQYFAANGTPLLLLSGQNRMFKMLGYDKTVFLENAPEYDGSSRQPAPQPGKRSRKSVGV
jgi:hypothetical protein